LFPLQLRYQSIGSADIHQMTGFVGLMRLSE
jgi:hypothetical protein